MDFGANKTPVEIIKEGVFSGRDIYSNVNEKQYKKSWKEFNHLKNIDIVQIIIDMIVNKYGVKCETSLRLD